MKNAVREALAHLSERFGVCLFVHRTNSNCYLCVGRVGSLRK